MPAARARSRACSGVTSLQLASRSDQREYFVSLCLHVLARDHRLQVEPQEGLGVRWPDVEVPVRIVDGDPVEPGDLGVGVALGQGVHLGVLVGDLGVDLAGDEVALVKGADELGQRPAGDREQLEHEQRRDRARVGAPELAEVVVARDLAAERRLALAHRDLEEGVTDPVQIRGAAAVAHRVGHRAAGAHVVEDRRPLVLVEHLARRAAR